MLGGQETMLLGMQETWRARKVSAWKARNLNLAILTVFSLACVTWTFDIFENFNTDACAGFLMCL